MSTCKWDHDKADYLTPDGDLCRHDEYGDPTRHCTAKRSCAHHVGPRELTCPRCLNDVRTNLRWIPDLAPLVRVEAIGDGVNSEAAWLAGPASDYLVFSARRALSRFWLMTHIPDRNLGRAMTALLEDDDELHPYGVLTRWHLMLAEDYGHPLPERMSVTDSAAYLGRNLNRFAQDDTQDFPLFRREIRKVREHLESVIHNSSAGQIGESCPACVERGGVNPKHVKLRREFGRWVYEGEEKGWRLRYSTNPSKDDEREKTDRWVCPRDQSHHWDNETYRNWVEERKSGKSA